MGKPFKRVVDNRIACCCSESNSLLNKADALVVQFVSNSMSVLVEMFIHEFGN